MQNYTLMLEPVNHDDHGDTAFKWHAFLLHGENIHWSDYWHEKPSLATVLKTASEALSQ